MAELARLIGQEDPFADFTGGARPRARASLPSPDPRTTRQEPRYDPRPDDRERDRERRRESYRTRSDGDGHERPSTRDTRAYSYGATPRPEREPEDRAAPTDSTYTRRLGVRDPLPVRGKETDAAYDTKGTSKYDPEYSDDAHLPEHGEEVLEDAQPRRSRTGLAIVAAVVSIAIVGTAGVFGYRAVFGPSTGRQPPVIGPQAGPNKVAPAGPATPESTKQFNDRVGGPSERIVPRDEAPIDVTARTGRPPIPGAAPVAVPGPAPAGPAPIATPTDGPRRVRTVTVRADGTVVADPTPAAPPAPARVAPARPGAPPMAVNTYAPPAEDPEPETPPAMRGRVTPAPTTTAPTARAPGPVWPPAAQPADPVAPQARVQTQAPAIQTPAAPAGYIVQVSSQRTEAEAQAAWVNLQARYSSVLAGRQATIRRTDLGDRGTFYRAQIGPFGNRDDANQLCQSLKSAGGECVVQRN